MIKRYKPLFSKIFFGAAILMSIGNLFASDSQKIGDIHASASGNAKVIGHASHVKTDNLMQNQGGQGVGSITINNAASSPLVHPERETPEDYYHRGVELMREDPPKKSQALSFFERAAGAKHDPYIDACIKCGEIYCEEGNTRKSSQYFHQALKLIERDGSQSHLNDSVYSGLMRLHLSAGKAEEDDVEEKKRHFIEASEYGKKMEFREKPDRDAIAEINRLLASLAVSSTEQIPVATVASPVAKGIPVSTGSEVDSNANVFAKAMVQAQEEQRLREEALQKQLEEAQNKASEAARLLEEQKLREEEFKRQQEESQKRLAAEEQKRLEAEKKAKETERLLEEQKRQEKQKEDQRQKGLREAQELAARQVQPVTRSIPTEPAIPDIARGYEDIYLRFLNGKLIYRPTEGSDVGKIELLIKDIMNPNTLEGTFDLSRCGDTGQYLSINTGYRKRKNPANKDKVEIWFCPRFLIEKELNSTAGHFRDIMTVTRWPQSAPIGVFWTWGSWDVKYYDYLTTNTYDQLGNNNLYEKYVCSCSLRSHHLRPPQRDPMSYRLGHVASRALALSRFQFVLSLFHVIFEPKRVT